MDKIDFEVILASQLNKKYYTPVELMYGNEPGFYLSPYDYGRYLDYIDEYIDSKDKDYGIVDLNLKTFNSKHIYYTMNRSFIGIADTYISLLEEAAYGQKELIANPLLSVAYKSRIYSEIEGSLNVENVPTTRKRLRELIEKDLKPENINDVIINNMVQGMVFLFSKPAFNKDNLLKLYKILSNGCLKKEDEIKEGNYYRDDDVEIDGFNGCPYKQVEECMDSLFAFVNDKLTNGKGLDRLFLSHICHYYILYIHPYIDFNGRTARMVSLWVNFLLKDNIQMPPLISEAINQSKNDYYRALRDSRKSRNDMTYFFEYIFKTAIKYILCYRDLDVIGQDVKNKGEILSETELNYVKRIMVSYKGKFSYLDFMKNCQIEISKQGAFKILNKFVDLGILVVVDTPSRNKLFDLNKKIIKYTKLN